MHPPTSTTRRAKRSGDPASDSHSWAESIATTRPVRDFFRHLHDPELLHANPLAASFLDGLGVQLDDGDHAAAALRRAVLAAADRIRHDLPDRAIGERQYRAIVEGDLQRHPADEVAGSLGISPRQFRRERNAARKRVVRELIRSAPNTFVSVLPNLPAIDIANAIRLSDAGKTDLALKLLVAITRGSPQTIWQIEALATAAEVDNDRESAAKVMSFLQAARERLSSQELDDRKRSLAARRIDLAAWWVAATRGNDVIDARAKDPLLEGPFRSAPPCDDGSWITECRQLALIRRGWQRSGSGMFAAAQADLVRFTDLTRNVAVPPSVAIDALLLEVNLAFTTGLHKDSAESLALRALEAAKQNGLVRRAAWAMMYLNHLRFERGERSQVLANARNNMLVATQLGLPDVIAALAISYGQFEKHCAHYDAATGYFDLAKRYARRGSLDWLVLKAESATVALRSGCVSVAFEDTIEVERIATSKSNARFQGMALQIRAECYFALGQRARAVGAIQQAIELLEKSGTQPSLATAYEACARITGRSDHRLVATAREFPRA